MDSAGRDKKRLRCLLGLYFFALALPTAILIRQASLQLQWESFHQQRMLAAELAMRIDARIRQIIEDEEARSASDYYFLVVAGDPAVNYVQRSVLANHHARPAVPGLVGYFQLDPRSMFTTPLLPPTRAEAAAYGVSGHELGRRLAVQSEVRRVLRWNGLLGSQADDWEKVERVYRHPAQHPAQGDEAGPMTEDRTGISDPQRRGQAPQSVPPGGRLGLAPQRTFDQLGRVRAEALSGKGPIPPGTLGRLDQLQLVSKFSTEALPDPAASAAPIPRLNLKKGASRKEKVVLLEMQRHLINLPGGPMMPQTGARPVAMFDAEVRPFDFAQLRSGHFLLFRYILSNRGRYVQGMVIDSEHFIRSVIGSAFPGTPLSRVSRLVVAYEQNILADLGGAPLEGEQRKGWRRDLLYRTPLSSPLDGLQLIFTSDRLPAGPGAALIAWLTGILTVVLCGGFLLMYRLGSRQIDVNRQQQDFVAAVSHELKTPLTSIRMYGEMLREGWVPDEKKPACYDFIYSECERLSRLIGNVLDFARMTRSGLDLALKPTRVGEVSEALRPKVESQVAPTGFELRWFCDPAAAAASINIDTDGFTQIVINLVDNALKFSAKSPRKIIEARWSAPDQRCIRFSVRDYGPGVPKDRRKTIFRLFYRLENELTRDTVGTGIGLALVHRLALAMHAVVDVVERDPGVEFRIRFQRVIDDKDG